RTPGELIAEWQQVEQPHAAEWLEKALNATTEEAKPEPPEPPPQEESATDADIEITGLAKLKQVDSMSTSARLRPKSSVSAPRSSTALCATSAPGWGSTPMIAGCKVMPSHFPKSSRGSSRLMVPRCSMPWPGRSVSMS